MSSEELREHLEHIAEIKDPSLAPVSFTMAILAVMVATVSLLGHRTHTEEMLAQTKAVDAWAYYQAKDTRFHAAQMFADLTGIVTFQDGDAAAKLRSKYQQEAEHYSGQKDERFAEAKKFEGEVNEIKKRANGYDLAEVFVEVALIITSITLLTHNRLYWYMGMVIGAAGLFLTIAAKFY